MYEDYALNEFLFHWQSQNSASPDSPVGLSYIKHKETGKKILMFVREQNRDEYGLAMSYVFLGEASFVKSYGARPMSIEWRLAELIPAGLLKESRFEDNTQNLYDLKFDLKEFFRSKLGIEVHICREKFIKPKIKEEILKETLYVTQAFVPEPTATKNFVFLQKKPI
jgi:hypothetical protein